MRKAGDIAQSFKQKHPRNKKTKFILKFDETKRDLLQKNLLKHIGCQDGDIPNCLGLDCKSLGQQERPQLALHFMCRQRDFLTGFHKRKIERRQRAQELLKKKQDEERKRKKQELRELRRKEIGHSIYESMNDVERVASSKVYELPSHTMTVTDATDIDFVGTGGLMLGTNQDDHAEPTVGRKSKTTPTADDNSLKSLSLQSKIGKKSRVKKKNVRVSSRCKKGKKKPRKKHKKKHS